MVILPFLLFLSLMTAALFGSAGSWNLPFFWAYVAVPAIMGLAMAPLMDRGLVKERLRPGPGGTDRHLGIWAISILLVHLVVAGLDVGRFHWSDSMPTWLQVAGLAGMALWMGISCWAMRVNRFFSPVVRLQAERGHHLVTGGPYRLIRHPGYLAALGMFPSGGLALGSWWSLAPLAGMALLILRRVVIEDKFLRENLGGYVGYAERVKYRLVPGVW